MPLRDQLAEERHLENLVDELRRKNAAPAYLANALLGLGQMRTRRSDHGPAREMLAEAFPSTGVSAPLWVKQTRSNRSVSFR